MLHLNLITTNTRSPRQVAWSPVTKYVTRSLWMYAFLKSHHNCNAYMDVQKERNNTFFIVFEQYIQKSFPCGVHRKEPFHSVESDTMALDKYLLRLLSRPFQLLCQ